MADEVCLFIAIGVCLSQGEDLFVARGFLRAEPGVLPGRLHRYSCMASLARAR